MSTSFQTFRGDHEQGPDDFLLEANNNNVQPASSFNWKKVLLVLSIIAASVFGALVVYSSSNTSTISKASITSFDAKTIVNSERNGVTFSDYDEDSKKQIFQEFVSLYKRKYDDKEFDTRFGHFKNFLDKVDERNSNEKLNGGTAVHGITKFSDYSPEEFQALLGYKSVSTPINHYIPTEEVIAAEKLDAKLRTPRRQATETVSPITPTEYIPPVYTGSATVVDWSGIYTTPVKDQGYCGSCWAFSTTEQIESDAKRVLGLDVELSVQQIVSCDKIDYGCDGGDTETAYQYVMSANGLALDSSYPYKSYWDQTLSCSETATNSKSVSISGYASLLGGVSSSSVIEERMKNYVLGKLQFIFLGVLYLSITISYLKFMHSYWYIINLR